ncbi:MAG: helix-turn-helix domain-containing protein [Candidatus Riflebacteria bacterium]|nr:helix-turn-helix domain-containing protein [Candidatus Riflebacteria bacterium]
MEKFYSVSEVAHILGITRQSVRKLPLPFIKLSRRKILLKKEDFNKFLQDNTESPRS